MTPQPHLLPPPKQLQKFPKHPLTEHTRLHRMPMRIPQNVL